jgi:urease alpha subunit
MNKRATKFLTVSSVSSDSIVKGIIGDIVNTAVKTAEVDEQKAKYLQHFINKHDTININRAPDNFQVQRVITPYF